MTNMEWTHASLILSVPQDSGTSSAELWLGAADVFASREEPNPTWLLSKRITVVINAARAGIDTHKLSDEFRRAAGLARVVELEMLDSRYHDGIREAFEIGAAAVHEALQAGHNTYVHCLMGMSRSSSVVLAYLIKYRRIPLVAALRMLRDRRPIVYPNIGFMLHLIALEQIELGVASLSTDAAHALHRETSSPTRTRRCCHKHAHKSSQQ